MIKSRYPLIFENAFCSHPAECAYPDVLIIGSGIGLASVPYLRREIKSKLGASLRIVVVDAGPLDIPTHLGNTPFPRLPILAAGTERIGGKLSLWGLSTPRPPERMLSLWPYSKDDLGRRFNFVEEKLGVLDPIPMSGRGLELCLLDLLQNEFPMYRTRVAPLAINRYGHRYSPLDDLPELKQLGVQFLARFHCEHLEMADCTVSAVSGQWLDGQSYTLFPKIIVLAVGIEPSLPLLRQVCCDSLPLEASDHIRIDLHGSLPRGSFGSKQADELGVAVLLMECSSREHQIPFHLEIKVAPRSLWARGFMVGADNLRGAGDDETLWVQIQAIAAMHDRFPVMDLLNIGGKISPVMLPRDIFFHAEIGDLMHRVASVIGLNPPVFTIRPLLTNHHTYGALRVGQAVSSKFQFHGVNNLYVLPPTSFVAVDDDANPALKSLVLSQYAMDSIVSQFGKSTSGLAGATTLEQGQ